MTMESSAIAVLVKDIIRRWESYDWTTQGFGMLRTYIDPDHEYRLSIWDHRLEIPGSNMVHDHPWDFHSWVLSGTIFNTRYIEVSGRPTHIKQCLHTGIGTSMLLGDRMPVRLRAGDVEVYNSGDTYQQLARELHITDYTNGTVTLNRRMKVGTGEHALVYWPITRQWVSAEPRISTYSEAEMVIAGALSAWDK